ncbi:MAG: hypothetical protein ACLRTR_05810 [Clostridia bacterium]
MNLPIEQIAKAVELNEEDVKEILNEKKIVIFCYSERYIMNLILWYIMYKF